MKTQEIRGKSPEDIQDLVEDCKERLFKLRFAGVTEKVENPAEIRQLRRTIARCKTVLKEGASS